MKCFLRTEGIVQCRRIYYLLCIWLSLWCVSLTEQFNSQKGLLNLVGINTSCKMWLTGGITCSEPSICGIEHALQDLRCWGCWCSGGEWKVRSRLGPSWGGWGVGGCLEQHVRVCPLGEKLLACFAAAWSLSVPTEGTVGSFGEYVPFVFNQDDFKLYEFLCLRLTFSVSPRTLQPWEGVFEHKYDSGFMEAACVSIVTHLHYYLPA